MAESCYAGDSRLDVIFTYDMWIFFQWPADFSAEQTSQNFLLASLLAVVIILIFFLLLLWFVARKQVRKPLWFGWAINGKGRRLTLEKIYPNPCPKCGGKMWYSKDQKWAAFLKCERNSEHLFKMDPAEEIVDESRWYFVFAAGKLFGLFVWGLAEVIGCGNVFGGIFS